MEININKIIPVNSLETFLKIYNDSQSNIFIPLNKELHIENVVIMKYVDNIFRDIYFGDQTYKPKEVIFIDDSRNAIILT